MIQNHDLFRDGDTNFHIAEPDKGLPATIPSADFLNSLQDEICSTIESFGFTLQSKPQLIFVLEFLKYANQTELEAVGYLREPTSET